jgi:hypothetical protein
VANKRSRRGPFIAAMREGKAGLSALGPIAAHARTRCSRVRSGSGQLHVKLTRCCTPCHMCLSGRELAGMRHRGGHTVAAFYSGGHTAKGAYAVMRATTRRLGVHAAGGSGNMLPWLVGT